MSYPQAWHTLSVFLSCVRAALYLGSLYAGCPGLAFRPGLLGVFGTAYGRSMNAATSVLGLVQYAADTRW